MNKKNVFIGILSIAIISFILKWRKERKNDNPKIFIANKTFRNYNGYILPPFGIVIHKRAKNNSDFLKHELTHWKQWQNGGGVFN